MLKCKQKEVKSMFPIEKAIESLKQKFIENIPESLYMDYQELSQALGSSPKQWEALLDDPEFKQFIEVQIAKYQEINARKALNRLANDPTLVSSDIQALNKVLESSKILQQKYNAKEHIVFSFIPPTQQTTTKEDDHGRSESDATTVSQHQMS